MKKTSLVLYLVLSALIISIGTVSAYTSGDAWIVVSVSPKNVAAGDATNVMINITNTIDDGGAKGISAIGFDLDWDDSVASWTASYAGTAFTSNFTDHLAGPGTDLITSWSSPGKISYAWIAPAGVPLAHGSGIPVVTFDHVMVKKSDGSRTTLHLSNPQVIDANANTVPAIHVIFTDDTSATGTGGTPPVDVPARQTTAPSSSYSGTPAVSGTSPVPGSTVQATEQGPSPTGSESPENVSEQGTTGPAAGVLATTSSRSLSPSPTPASLSLVIPLISLIITGAAFGLLKTSRKE